MKDPVSAKPTDDSAIKHRRSSTGLMPTEDWPPTQDPSYPDPKPDKRDVVIDEDDEEEEDGSTEK